MPGAILKLNISRSFENFNILNSKETEISTNESFIIEDISRVEVYFIINNVRCAHLYFYLVT